MNKQDSLRWSNEKHDDIDAMSVKQLKNALKTFGVTSYNGLLEKQDFRNRLRSFMSPTTATKNEEQEQETTPVVAKKDSLRWAKTKSSKKKGRTKSTAKAVTSTRSLDAPAVAIEMTTTATHNPMTKGRKKSVILDFTDTYDVYRKETRRSASGANPMSHQKVKDDDNNTKPISSSNNSNRCKIIIGIVLCLIVVAGAGIAAFLLVGKNNNNSSTNNNESPSPISTNTNNNNGDTDDSPADTPKPEPSTPSACDGVDCLHGGTCTAIEDGFQCTSCRKGYHGFRTNSICSNIDECSSTTNPHNCHTHATCSDNPGSFNCACNEGYSGTGRICSEVSSADAYASKIISSSNIIEGMTVEQFKQPSSQIAFKRAVAESISVGSNVATTQESITITSVTLSSGRRRALSSKNHLQHHRYLAAGVEVTFTVKTLSLLSTSKIVENLMLLKNDATKRQALLNKYNIEHIVANLESSSSSSSSNSGYEAAPSLSAAATATNAAAILAVRLIAADGSSDADIIKAAVNAAKITAKSHSVEDPNDLVDIVSKASTSAVATIFANRARGLNNDATATAKVGTLAQDAAIQSGLSVVAANNLAASKASQAVSMATLEPILSISTTLLTSAGPPLCEWNVLRKPFVDAIAATAGVTSDRVTIITEPVCGSSGSSSNGGRRRLRRVLGGDVSVTFAVSCPMSTTTTVVKNTLVAAITDGSLSGSVSDNILTTDSTAVALSSDTISRPSNPQEIEHAALSPSQVGQHAKKAALGAGVSEVDASKTAGLQAATAVASSQAKNGVLDATLGQASAAAASGAGLDDQTASNIGARQAAKEVASEAISKGKTPTEIGQLTKEVASGAIINGRSPEGTAAAEEAAKAVGNNEAKKDGATATSILNAISQAGAGAGETIDISQVPTTVSAGTSDPEISVPDAGNSGGGGGDSGDSSGEVETEQIEVCSALSSSAPALLKSLCRSAIAG